MDKEKITAIVEACFEIASNADLPGSGSLYTQLPDGTVAFDSLRYAVFQSLINHLVPYDYKVDQKNDVTVREPKEEWQQ